ncbi:MAG: phosphate ABC transporter substrate-binding/OmpA family protein [Pseudomonadota bacterium]|nr:phosphate ABC transporter substrate-binding/OmpA family protein [Pseudomonadota bacterium]
MTFFRTFICISAFLFSALAAAAPEPFATTLPAGDVRLLTIHGSNTIGAELAPNLIRAWLQAKGAEDVRMQAAEHENEMLITGLVPATNSLVSVLVAAHGSGTGFKGLVSGEADIAAASRPAKQKEADLLREMTDLYSPASEHIVGIDGLAIIVHPQNPLNELNVDAIAGIFSGKYTDWSELGGKSGPIHVYARDDKSGTWDSFKGMVLGKRPLTATAKRYESNAELSDNVSSDPAGIGFVGLSSVRLAKLLSVSDGNAKSLSPNKLTVATEDYALSRRLFMYTDDEPANPYVSEFIRFVVDDAGQKIVADTGFISQEVKAVIPEFYEELPQDFRDITRDAQRLTINFRFQQGSAKLDNKALKDLERLVSYINEHKDSELVLVGFGDPKKTEKRSQLLSKLRAMAVRRELVRYGIYPQASVGFGDDLPVASVTGNDGRVKNRRVEVWVKNLSSAS